jgi:hypothetical protein
MLLLQPDSQQTRQQPHSPPTPRRQPGSQQTPSSARQPRTRNPARHNPSTIAPTPQS